MLGLLGERGGRTYAALGEAETAAAVAQRAVGLAGLAVGEAASLNLSHGLTLLLGDALFSDGKGLFGALAGLLKVRQKKSVSWVAWSAEGMRK